MDPMTVYVAKVMIHGWLSEAENARPGRRLEREIRAERRRRRSAAIARWWRARTSRRPGSAPPTMAVAAAPPVRPPSIEVAEILAAAAHRVAEWGTTSERRLLEAMAEVSAPSAPGAAAALVDWAGSEASRQRAFGLVHTHLIEVLGAREHAWPSTSSTTAGDLETTDRVA